MATKEAQATDRSLTEAAAHQDLLRERTKVILLEGRLAECQELLHQATVALTETIELMPNPDADSTAERLQGLAKMASDLGWDDVASLLSKVVGDAIRAQQVG